MLGGMKNVAALPTPEDLSACQALIRQQARLELDPHEGRLGGTEMILNTRILPLKARII